MQKTIKKSSGKGAIGFAGLQTQPSEFDDESQTVSVRGPGQSSERRTVGLDEAVGALMGGEIVERRQASSAGQITAKNSLGGGVAVLGPTDVRTKKLRPVERLTGISSDRPEILAVLRFQPAFAGDGSQKSPKDATSVGRFISRQRSSRSLGRKVATRVVASASRSRQIATRVAAVNRQLQELSETSRFMLDSVRLAETVRSALDVRRGSTSTALAAKVGLVDVLAKLGYDRGALLDDFTSSKVWLQSLIELRDIVRFHTPDLIDSKDQSRKKNVSPTIVTRSGTRFFSFGNGLSQLTPLKGVRTLSGQNLLKFASVINSAYSRVYDGPTLVTAELKAAALTTALSKEIRFSRGLSDAQVLTTLKFGFLSSPKNGDDNADVLDSVFGAPGTSIFHVIESNAKSMASLAHRQITSDEAVLTFESEHIDTSIGIFTPGSSYYVDEIFEIRDGKFQTLRMKQLGGDIAAARANFGKIATGMNFDGKSGIVQTASAQKSGDRTALSFSTPSNLYSFVLSSVIDRPQTRRSVGAQAQQSALADPLTALYAEAVNDAKLKSLLMLMTLFRLERESLNAGTAPSFDPFPNVSKPDKSQGHVNVELLSGAVRDHIQQRIGKQRQIVVPKAGDTQLIFDTVKSSMISGTKFLKLIDSTFSTVMSAFAVDGGKAFVSLGDRVVTRFGAHVDTSMCMAVFDLICTVISQVTEHRLGGVSNKQIGKSNQLCLTIQKTATADRDKKTAEVLSRLARDSEFTAQFISAVSATLGNVVGSIRALTDRLESSSSTKELAKIASILGDETALRATFTPQQVMLVASAVDDMLDASSSAKIDADDTGVVDRDEVVKFLDDSSLSPAALNVLDSLLKTGEFCSTRAHNKKIIVVGVPFGFVEHLKNQVVGSADLGERNRQQDIVTVNVHKIDVQLPDVVFMPLKLHFELSRFVVKSPSKFSRPSSLQTVDAVASSIPTRDYGALTAKCEYASQDAVNRLQSTAPGARTEKNRIGAAVAFQDAEHSFLSQYTRSQILRNHVVGFLMESYVRILTGINISEHHFTVDDVVGTFSPEIIADLVDSRVRYVIGSFDTNSQRRAGDGMFGHIGVVSGPDAQSARRDQDAQQKISARDPVEAVRSAHPDAQRVIGRDIETLSGISREITTLSEPIMVARKAMQPRAFDRVLTLIVDPDDFEIDVSATVKTEHGRRALGILRDRGEIVAVRSQGTATQSTASFRANDRLRIRERDLLSGDISIERYFVTIEPFDGTSQ